MNHVKATLSVCAVTLALSAAQPARAEEDGPGSGCEAAAGGASAGRGKGVYTRETWPTQEICRPLTLAKGLAEIRGDIFVNMSTNAVFQPFAIAPSAYYGIDDKLTVGVTTAEGLCLTGTSNGCAKVYNDLGFDALYSIQGGPMALAADAGIDLGSFDPFLLGIHAGVNGRYRQGQIAVVVNPRIYFGFTNRGQGVAAMPSGGPVNLNNETISIPIEIHFQATPALEAFFRTGFGTPLEGIGPIGVGDLYNIPLGIGGLFAVSRMIDVGASFTFINLAAHGSASATDFRALDILVNFRL